MVGDATAFVLRPVMGYQEQGAQAWLNGLSLEANPHVDGTLASADWRVGYLAEAKLASDGDAWTDEAILLEDEDLHARSERSQILTNVRWLLPSAETAAAAINLPTEKWPLNCHLVATLIVSAQVLQPLEAQHGPARACYGIYEGPIAQRSPFASKPVARHGWIEFASGLVIDPTRWVFEGTKPYIWAGSTDNYDLGANRLRNAGSKPPPAYDASAKQIRLVANDPTILELLGDLLGDKDRLVAEGRTSLQQACWLANPPPEIIGERTPEVFRELDRMGCGAFIPVDNRAQAMPDCPLTPNSQKHLEHSA